MSSVRTLLNRLKKNPRYIRITFVAMGASVLLLAGLFGVGLFTASADKVKVEEVFGTGALTQANIGVETDTLSDCGDGDPNTNFRHNTLNRTSSWTGIIEGTATGIEEVLTANCATPSTGVVRQVAKFKEVTVAGRTGGLALEIIGDGTTPPNAANIRLRFLCGSGDLKHVHGEGIFLRYGTIRHYAMWIHFGHNHDVGYDFLCEDL